MKRYLECFWLVAGIFVLLLTNKAERRQYQYDLDGDEIER